jgi:pimeloyl-ACP methyl ester carboxylesterase
MDIFLIHGKAGSPDGSSLHLEQLLRPVFPDAKFHRPLLPHADPEVLAEDSLVALRALEIPQNAYVIGVSLGGLLAARLQETGRPDLHVLALSSPTWVNNVHLASRPANRVAVYSSNDAVLGGGTPQSRVLDWPRLAEAHDVPWLSHDTKAHKHQIAPLLVQWLRGEAIHLP